jgi:hypothetical protein
MPTVEVTKHLWDFLPTLRDKTLSVRACTVAEVVREVEGIAPGFTDYICDERGCLRTHVNIFVGDERILDRTRLRMKGIIGRPSPTIYRPFTACASAKDCRAGSALSAQRRS